MTELIYNDYANKNIVLFYDNMALFTFLKCINITQYRHPFLEKKPPNPVSVALITIT